MIPRPDLQIIDGGKRCKASIGPVVVECVTEQDSDSCQADASVIEEDTWQVLSADPTIREVDEHPIRMMTALIDQERLEPGSVLEKGRRWHAVIYDFDHEPICVGTWVVSVLDGIFNLATDKQVQVLKMPLPGVSHGCIGIRDVIDLLVARLQSDAPSALQKLILVAADGNCREVCDVLSSLQSAG